MTKFDYTISDSMGLHARPVGLVVKATTPFKNTNIAIVHGEKRADAKRMFAVMALAVKQGETITVEVEGEEEEKVAGIIKDIFVSEKL